MFICPERIPEVPKFLGPFNILEKMKKRSCCGGLGMDEGSLLHLKSAKSVFSPLCSELFHCMSERQVFPAPVLL
jgi:hypothetical protein